MRGYTYQPRTDEDWEKRTSQQGGGFQGYISDEYRTYALKKGDNAIRILPPTWEGARHYGMDIHVHFSVGPDKASVLCPYRMAEQPCPICEIRSRAEKQGEDELAKELRPSKRVLVWVLDRKDEDKGPVVWGMPWTLDRDISKVSRDRTSGKFYFVDHPDEGFDIYFDREGEGLTTKYTGVQLARRATSVDEHWIEYIQQHPLPETLLIRDYNEIKELYEGTKATAAPEEAPPRPLQRGNGAAPEKPEKPARPALNRPGPAGVRAGSRFESVAAEPKPGDEPPPDDDAPPFEADAPRRPAPTTPAEAPVPAAAAAASPAASKAASLRDRFARKG